MPTPSRFVTRSVLAVGALALTVPAFAATASAGTGGPRVLLQAAPAWTSSARQTGPAASGQQVHASVILALRDPAAAEALAARVSDPASPAYRHYVTPAAWRARFAPTDADVARVTRALRAAGLHVEQVPANHRYVAFSGTPAAVANLIGTSLATYAKNGRSERAPAGPVKVPAGLARLVVGISGLDTSRRSVPNHTTGAGPAATPAAAPARSAPARLAATASTARVAGPQDTLPPPGLIFRNAPPFSTYYGQNLASGLPQILANPLSYAPRGYVPGQIRSAYGLDQVLAAGYDGRGARVAVVDAYASPYILGDAQTYARRNDPRHPLRSYQFAQSKPANYTFTEECGASGWYGEETLDVEAVHATAPAADILYVGAVSCQNVDLNAAVNTVVDNGLADVITNSYGSGGEAPVADVYEEHQTYLQAAAQGISVLFSSGDSGDEIAALGQRTVDTSANDPYVTAVGGTALAVGASGQYLFEQGWGTGKSVLTNGSWKPIPPAFIYGGGGGVSRVWPQPSYQKGVVPDSIARYFGGMRGRAVPDVAMDADPSTGFLVGQTQSLPDGTLTYGEYRIGGTSLSSPLFAGVVAVANQAIGYPLGFVNPLLYSQGKSRGLIRDVDAGRAVTRGVVRVDYVNGVNASDGTVTSLRTLNQTGTLFTRRGYDDVTGVGSPTAQGLLRFIAKRGTGHGGGRDSGHPTH